jgi:hypothetical protein
MSSFCYGGTMPLKVDEAKYKTYSYDECGELGYPFREPKVFLDGCAETYFPQYCFDWENDSVVFVREKQVMEYTRSHFWELLARDEVGNIVWVDGRYAPYSGCWDGEYLDEIRAAHGYTITEYDLEALEKRKYKVVLDSTTTLNNDDLRRMTKFVDAENITSHFTITDGVLCHYVGLDEDLVIPDMVTEIADGAFENHQHFNSITIPKNLINISSDSFKHCTTNNIYVAEDNPKYCCRHGCLIDKTNGTLIWGCRGDNIPDDGSIKKIGPHAFRGCTGLKRIVIPDSVTEIDPGAFNGCCFDEISIPDAFADRLKDIYWRTFVKEGDIWKAVAVDKNFSGFCF